MSTYGIETLEKIGSGITVSADGRPKQKAGGITIAWAAVPALTRDYRFLHEDYAFTTEKFLRYGTVMCRITAATDATEVGKFMPYMASPGGGRTLATTKGDVFVLNQSVHADEQGSDHLGEAIEGGRVYTRRILVVGLGDGTSTSGAVPQGSGATFTATFAAGAVDSITITDGGEEYPDGTHSLTLSGGGGTGATATATVVDGVVTSVAITAGGSGYTSAPAVSLSVLDRLDEDLEVLGVSAMARATFESACPNFTYVSDGEPA